MIDFRRCNAGFVDAHYLLWSGDRSADRMRQQGMSYKDIAATGGGIRYKSKTRGVRISISC